MTNTPNTAFHLTTVREIVAILTGSVQRYTGKHAVTQERFDAIVYWLARYAG